MARISENQRNKWMLSAGIIDNSRSETIQKTQVTTKKDSLKKLLEQLDAPEDEDLAPEGEEDFGGMPNLEGGEDELDAPDDGMGMEDEMGMDDGMGGEMDMGDDMLGDDMGMEDELSDDAIGDVINISNSDAAKLTKKIAATLGELFGLKITAETEGDMSDDDGMEDELEDDGMGGEEDFEASDEDMDMDAEEGMEDDGMGEENPLPSIDDEEEEDEEYKAIAESIRRKIRSKAASIKNKKKI
jgi:hypothetical protein